MKSGSLTANDFKDHRDEEATVESDRQVGEELRRELHRQFLLVLNGWFLLFYLKMQNHIKIVHSKSRYVTPFTSSGSALIKKEVA